MSDLISRQAAIDALKAAYWDKNIQSAKDDPCIVDAMTDWAIRQIKVLPSAQPTKINALETLDCVSRQPEQKTGEWIEHEDVCECPYCHEEWNYCDNDTYRFSYCPNCGADMRGEKEQRK